MKSVYNFIRQLDTPAVSLIKPIPQKMTPMLTQYLAIKKGAPDAILFYRMGDFYEMFFEDAVKAALILDVQLTSRDKNSENPIPMCGVPHHAATGYIQKLVQHGLKVAICDQIGDPSAQKGIIERKITRVITPGLIGNPDLIDADSSSYLLAIVLGVSVPGVSDGTLYHVALAELLSGRVMTGSVLLDELTTLIVQRSPREILLAEKPEVGSELERLISPKLMVTVRPNFFGSNKTALDAVRFYALETQGGQVDHGTQFFSVDEPLKRADKLLIDSVALKALEILQGNSLDRPELSLFGCIDQCHTSMGRRLLKTWLAEPLCEEMAIQKRQEAVGVFFRNLLASEQMAAHLRGMRDLERLTTKNALGFSNPTDLLAIARVQSLLPELKATLLESNSQRLRECGGGLHLLSELVSELNLALNDEVPVSFREGGIFQDTYRADLGELRSLTRDSKAHLMALEERERQKTGISSLKIRFNRVFGYSIEVTKTHLAKIPSHYVRKQTLSTGERYLTDELQELETKILSAEDRLKRLEEQIFLDFRLRISKKDRELKENARILAEIDVYLSFAHVARAKGYVRPNIRTGWNLAIVEGRHPILESILKPGQFVPNSTKFDFELSRTLLITGPNMAGKSTMMRQVALIVILAHCGSYVPCRHADIPVVDAIYTRIGSSDDLGRGQSTFMVEMAEVANILKNATERSLILIDEIGRGTSTYDGLSLAWSLLEYIHLKLKSKTLFATHFHELTVLENQLSGLINMNVLVRRVGEQIVFLHRLENGACSQSYGVDVARLAELPSEVLLRAKDILSVLESQSQRGYRTRSKALEVHDKQLGFLEV